jgi:hypothetical protein
MRFTDAHKPAAVCIEETPNEVKQVAPQSLLLDCQTSKQQV